MTSPINQSLYQIFEIAMGAAREGWFRATLGALRLEEIEIYQTGSSESACARRKFYLTKKGEIVCSRYDPLSTADEKITLDQSNLRTCGEAVINNLIAILNKESLPVYLNKVRPRLCLGLPIPN